MDVVCELSVGIAFQHVPSSYPSKKRAFGVGLSGNSCGYRGASQDHQECGM